MENPYSLVFGKMPANYIDRELELNEIIETYSEEEPSIRAYALTGLRGCGKTVALSFVEKYFRKQKDFIVISLNSDLNMFEQTLEHLSEKKLLDDLKISVSMLDVTLEKKQSVESLNYKIEQYLECISKKRKRILFTIDEISNTQNIKAFFQSFNIWLRKDYDIVILMAGLKKNILALQKDNRISFLKRAEKKDLKQLSLNSIMLDYKNNLQIPDKEAGEMALFTKGYSYAFQVLGYLCFRTKKNYKDVIDLFDEKLTNNVYDIIWEDLSSREKEVLQAIFGAKELTTQEILRTSGIDKNTYNEYRRILISKDILIDKGYGKIDFTLPRFKEIACRNIELGFWKE